MKTTLTFLLLIPLLGAAACGPDPADRPAPARETRRTETAQTAPPAAAPGALSTGPAIPSGPVVVFLGDSLTAGLGLDEGQAYPARVAERLAARGTPIRAINAGVSGDTTAGGLARIDWLLRQHPDVMVVGLGGNDGLRGVPLDAVEKNLREILRRSRAAGVRVLLLGMKIPPNYGPEYSGGFEAMYPRLAREMDIPLVPFLLEGVGGIARLNQDDGIHPTAEGQERVADTVTPYLTKMLVEESVTARK
jgi:acyl-CoA thioesterase-1